MTPDQVNVQFLGNLILGLALLAGLAVAIVVLFKRRPPIEAEFVTKLELQQLKKEMNRDIDSLRERLDERFDKLSEKMDENKTELLLAGERRSSDIHDRITGHESRLARIEERTSS